MEQKQSQTIMYANILKIMASIAVVMIHVVGIYWRQSNISIYQWNILNLYDSICRWSVPIFVMVTGMLLLRKEKPISVSQIFSKYIKKILIILIVWSIIFAVLNAVIEKRQINSILDMIDSLFVSNYHLWYLYMLIGLYLVTPIIKKLVDTKDKSVIQYFLILWFVFECCLKTLIRLPIFYNVNIAYGQMQIGLILGYVGYYLLGYYLHTYDLKEKTKKIIYILGIISAIVIISVTNYLKINNFKNVELLYNFLSAPVCLTAMSLFMIIKQNFSEKELSQRTEDILKRWTKLSFGVYLTHPIFIIFMQKLNISILKGEIALTIPLATIIIYLLSIIFTYILSKIPILGKNIV